jgi:hypothetical protein
MKYRTLLLGATIASGTLIVGPATEAQTVCPLALAPNAALTSVVSPATAQPGVTVNFAATVVPNQNLSGYGVRFGISQVGVAGWFNNYTILNIPLTANLPTAESYNWVIPLGTAPGTYELATMFTDPLGYVISWVGNNPANTVVVTNPVVGAVGSDGGQTFAALTAGDPKLCLAGTVASFAALSSTWTWTCSGSGGGASDTTGLANLGTPQKIWRAADLVDSIGVVTHVSYNGTGFAYTNRTAMIAALQYMGFTNVRESNPAVVLTDPRLQWYVQYLTAGFKMSFTTQPGPNAGVGQAPGSDVVDLDYFMTNWPAQVLAAEGLNEPDLTNDGFIFTYTPAGGSALTGPAAVARYQIDMYAAIKADPKLATLPVWGYSLNSTPYNQISYEQVYAANTAVLAATDAVNIGAYGGYYSPGVRVNQIQGYAYDIGSPTWTTFSNGPYAALYAGKPLIMKETGSLALPAGGISGGTDYLDYPTQAKLLPSMLLDTLYFGSSHSFVYELADVSADSLTAPANFQDHWGLYDNAWNAKPAAAVFHNMLGALKVQYPPAAPAYAVEPLTVTVPQFPLHPAGTASLGSGYTISTQQPDGSYLILVWYEPILWNQTTGAASPAVATVPVTMNLSRTCATTSIYDPLTGGTTAGPSAVASIPLALPDHMLMVSCAGHN